MTLFEDLFPCIVPTFIQCCTSLGFLPALIKDTARAIGWIFLLNEFYSVNNLIWMDWSAHSAVWQHFLGWRIVWAWKLYKYWFNGCLVTWLKGDRLLHLSNFTATEHRASWSEFLYRLLVRHEIYLTFCAVKLIIIVLFLNAWHIFLRYLMLYTRFSRRLYLDEVVVVKDRRC